MVMRRQKTGIVVRDKSFGAAGRNSLSALNLVSYYKGLSQGIFHD
jgi:hypothetical protein